jgi:RNA polymerase sigma factor (sigma-70 family)
MDSSSRPRKSARISGPPIALLGDDRLARLVESGSERAFAVIYERYHQRLYRYACSILHDGDDAHDALQSTLARAFSALQRGQLDAPLCPWLFRIAHNEAISLIRRRRVEDDTEASERCVPSADESARERRRLAALVADLRELPERQRSALVMRELSGLSHKEIAASLGISVHTVRHAILQARRSLVECEEGRLMPCQDAQRMISSGDGRMLRRWRMRSHLRCCTACAALADTIPERRADLQALFPPLSPVLAASLLARLLGSGSAHGLRTAGMAGGLSCKTVGATVTAKTLLGISIVAVTGAGMTSALALAREDTGNARSAPTLDAAHLLHRGQHARPKRQSGAARHKALALARPDAPASAAGGIEPRSSDTAGGVSGASEDPPAAGSVGHPWRSPAAGTPPWKGTASQRGGQGLGGPHGGAAGGRPGTRAGQPGRPGRALGLGGHPADPPGRPSTGANAGGEHGAPGVAGRPAGHPPPATPMGEAPAVGSAGQPEKGQGPAVPREHAPAPAPPQNRPLTAPGQSPAGAS